MVEEASARIVIEDLVQRLLPAKKAIVIPHEGKSDLQTSFPRKLLAWRHPPALPFIILHDNDNADCTQLKSTLAQKIPPACQGRTRIRLVMQSLESWYLGDFQALCDAGLIKQERAAKLSRSAKFKDPDGLANPKQEFMRLHQEVGQLMLARQIAPHLSPDRNRSKSFGVFIRTVADLLP